MYSHKTIKTIEAEVKCGDSTNAEKVYTTHILTYLRYLFTIDAIKK